MNWGMLGVVALPAAIILLLIFAMAYISTKGFKR